MAALEEVFDHYLKEVNGLRPDRPVDNYIWAATEAGYADLTEPNSDEQDRALYTLLRHAFTRAHNDPVVTVAQRGEIIEGMMLLFGLNTCYNTDPIRHALEDHLAEVKNACGRTAVRLFGFNVPAGPPHRSL